jgi:hypothetical protein
MVVAAEKQVKWRGSKGFNHRGHGGHRERDLRVGAVGAGV